MTKKKKIKSFDEFQEGLLEQEEFYSVLHTLKWIVGDDEESKALQIGMTRELYKRYIAINKKFEGTDPHRIGSGSTSRRLS